MEQSQADDSDIFYEESASQVGSSVDKVDDSELWNMETSIKDLNKKIELKKEEINMLKDIISKQLENQQDLQMKYEEENIALKQMPKNQQIATERYEESVEIATSLQLQQCEINQSLESAFELYDNTLQLIENTRENFNTQLQVGKQRKLIYEADLVEMKNIGENILSKTTQRIKDKKLLIEIAKNNLSKYNSDVENERIATVEGHIRMLKSEEEELNQTILKIQNEIQRCREDANYIRESFTIEQKKVTNKINELNELVEREEMLLNENHIKTQELLKLIADLKESNDKLKIDSAAENELVILLKKESQEKQAIIDKLTEKFNGLEHDLPELSIIMENLSIKEENIKILEQNIQKFEEELQSDEQLVNSLQLQYKTLKECAVNQESELNNIIASNKDLEEKIHKIREEIEAVNARVYSNEKSLQDKEVEISNKISKLTLERNHIINTITNLENDLKLKKDKIEELNHNILTKKLEIQDKSKQLGELEHEIEQMDLFLLHETETISMMCDHTEQEITALRQHNETVNNIKQNLTQEKLRFDRNLKEFNDKHEAITKMYNRDIDIKLNEFEELKKSLSVEEERYNDEYSKVNYQYYTLKNEKRCYSNEMNYMTSVINRCQGEYVIMESYLDWITRKASCFMDKSDTDTDSDDLGQIGGQDEEFEQLPSSSVDVKAMKTTRPDNKDNRADNSSCSSLDLPAEPYPANIWSTPAMTRSASIRSATVARTLDDAASIITIDSSDSELPAPFTAPTSSTTLSRKPVVFSPAVRFSQPIKTFPPGKQKLMKKKTSTGKVTTTTNNSNKNNKKTILDYIVDSD